MSVSNLRLRVNSSDYGLPNNWRELEWSYDFNGLDTISQNIGPEFVYCGLQPFTLLQTQASENICGEVSLDMQIQCTPQGITSWDTIFQARARVADARFLCTGGAPSCQVSIESKRHNFYSVLEDSAGDAICVDCVGVINSSNFGSRALRVAQIQSGGFHREASAQSPFGLVDVSRCFVNAIDLVNKMGDELGYTTGSASGNDVWNRNFLHQITRITIPNGNDTAISLNITGDWGMQHVINFTLPTGQNVINKAIAFKKAILARDYNGTQSNAFNQKTGKYARRMHEIFSGISAIQVNAGTDVRPAIFLNESSTITARANGQIDIITDWPIRTITVSGNVSGAFATSVVQNYQYGLKTLYFSANGLKEKKSTANNAAVEANVCTNWNKLKYFLTNVHPTVFNTTDASMSFSGYDATFNSVVGTVSTSVLNPKGVEWRIRPDIQYNKALFGQPSIIDELEDSNAGWVWYGLNLSPNIQGPMTGGATENETMIASTPTGGRFTVSGCFYMRNTTSSTFAYNIQLVNQTTGVVIGTLPTSVNLAPNAERKVDLIGNTVNDPLSGCVGASQQIVLRFSAIGTPPASGNVIIAYASSTGGQQCGITASITSADEDYPLTLDDSMEVSTDVYYDFANFSNCTGIKDSTLADDFYTGVGYAFTQQLEGLVDYEDTIFCTFGFPSTVFSDLTVPNGSNTSTWMFERQIFFPNGFGADACYNNQLISYFYHNIPIQAMWIASEWAKYFPSNINHYRYIFQNNVAWTGGTNEPTLTSSSVTLTRDGAQIQRTHKRTKLYEFEACQTVIERLQRGIQKGAQFNNCGNGTVKGVVRKMTSRLDEQGLSSFTIEAE